VLIDTNWPHRRGCSSHSRRLSLEHPGRDAPAIPASVLLDGSARLPRETIGNKGYGINAMRRNGLPVLPAFCITSEACRRFIADPDHALSDIAVEVLGQMRCCLARIQLHRVPRC
jgi:Pyruvate phosphate dikinase, AMP/ATP-binding domain